MKKVNMYAQIALVFIGLLLIVGSVSGAVAMVVKYYPVLIVIGVVGIVFAYPALTDLAKQGGTYLYNKFIEFLRQSTVCALPCFNTQLTAAVICQALTSLSYEHSGIKEVISAADIKWSWISKDNFTFLRFQVKRAGKEAFSQEDIIYLTTLIQDKVQNILVEQYPSFAQDMFWNKNEWCVITTDEVRQVGVYFWIDAIWVQDYRVADYLRNKHFGIPDTQEAATPTDSDF